jgi:hypothetical protein
MAPTVQYRTGEVEGTQAFPQVHSQHQIFSRETQNCPSMSEVGILSFFLARWRLISLLRGPTYFTMDAVSSATRPYFTLRPVTHPCKETSRYVPSPTAVPRHNLEISRGAKMSYWRRTFTRLSDKCSACGMWEQIPMPSKET